MAQSSVSVTAHDRVVDELKRLHDTQGMTWREIAKKPRFRGIKYQRLNKIYLTGIVPDDLKKRFKIPKKPQPPEWVTQAADWLAEREQSRNVYKRIIGQKGET